MDKNKSNETASVTCMHCKKKVENPKVVKNYIPCPFCGKHAKTLKNVGKDHKGVKAEKTMNAHR